MDEIKKIFLDPDWRMIKQELDFFLLFEAFEYSRRWQEEVALIKKLQFNTKMNHLGKKLYIGIQ